MCCQGRRGRGTCLKERCGATSRAPNIPGSIWLPDTGYGELAPGMADYFFEGPGEGDQRRSRQNGGPLLSGRLLDVVERGQARALLGYSDVVWYPEGTDGWLAAHLPLQDCTPEPRPGE